METAPAEYSGNLEKECAKAHSRAEARLLRQPSAFAPSAHPRGAFCMIGRNFLSYKKTKMPFAACQTRADGILRYIWIGADYCGPMY